MTRVSKSIIKGLEELADYSEGKKVKGIRTTRNVKIVPVPHLKGKKIREIRLQLNISQKIFADIMGVSNKTIEAWEAGTREPTGSAQRLLSLLSSQNNFIENNDLMVKEA